jgi:hypothetical protein
MTDTKVKILLGKYPYSTRSTPFESRNVFVAREKDETLHGMREGTVIWLSLLKYDKRVM